MCTAKCLNWQSDYADFKCHDKLDSKRQCKDTQGSDTQPDPNILSVSSITTYHKQVMQPDWVKYIFYNAN